MTQSLFPRPIIDDTGAIKSDWKSIIDEGTRKIVTTAVTNGTTTMYTVPAGKIFYLIFAQLTHRVSGATANPQSYFRIAAIEFMNLQMKNADDHFFSIVGNFTIPLKLVAGETVQIVSSSGDVETKGSIAGYEV